MNQKALKQANARVIQNIQLAEKTWRIRLNCPEIAQIIFPGQFLMLREQWGMDPLLARPFALYDTVLDMTGNPIGIDIVYLVVGKLTNRLRELRENDSLEVWGPLGNGFPELLDEQEVNLVAGGIGQTPFLAYAQWLLGNRSYRGNHRLIPVKVVRLFYGVRSSPYLAGVEDFARAGVEIHLATEDGTIGHQGRITERIEGNPPNGPYVGCGPEPMLERLAEIASLQEKKCYVSLETPMACGYGVCFSCVTKVKQGCDWDYHRVCVEGPVFDAALLQWKNNQISDKLV